MGHQNFTPCRCSPATAPAGLPWESRIPSGCLYKPEALCMLAKVARQNCMCEEKKTATKLPSTSLACLCISQASPQNAAARPTPHGAARTLRGAQAVAMSVWGMRGLFAFAIMN